MEHYKALVVPPLAEGDLDTELHLHIIDLLEASDEETAQHHSRCLLVRTVATRPLKI